LAGGGSGAELLGGESLGFTGVTNARSIGQLTTEEGRVLRARVLFRSGDLAAIADCSELSEYGIRSVVDLRDLEHPDYAPDAACVSSSTRFYEADLPRLLPPSADIYYDTLVAAEPELGAIFGHLSATDALPALIHCVIGRDRASLVMGLVLLAVGVPRSQVLDDMTTNQDAGIVIEAAWMDRVFEWIDEAGGIAAYLEQHGVTEAQLAPLREQALMP
jgi:protein-tyrosine phosphatase